MGKIVWLASYPESGANWLSLFLANLIAGSQKPCSKRDRDMIVPAEISANLFQPFFEKPLAEVPVRELAEMRPTVHRAIAKRTNGFIFLRTHCAAVRHFGVPTITPEATAAAIYIVRNPLDVAASYAAARARPLDKTIARMAQSGRLVGKSSKKACQLVGSWSENVESWTAGTRARILCIRFEEMLENPEGKFSDVVRFLGVKATPEQIAKASENAIIGVLQDHKKVGSRAKALMSPLELLRAGALIRGQRLLTTQQMATIAGVHRDQMRKFGYWH